MDEPVNPITLLEQIPIKYQAIGILQEEGLAKKDIAQALDITRQRVSQVQSRLSSMGITGNVKRLKKAVQAHDKILKSFADNDINKLPDKLKISDVNTCIDRVLDRHEPKVNRNENLNLNVDLSPVDLAEFRRK
jgi:predicted transcriptional regulator